MVNARERRKSKTMEWLEEGAALIRVVRTDLMEEGPWKPRHAGVSHWVSEGEIVEAKRRAGAKALWWTLA